MLQLSLEALYYVCLCVNVREVIERRPEEFKIHCLKQIRAIFPGDFSPLHAGFGNRHTVSAGAMFMWMWYTHHCRAWVCVYVYV